MTPPANDVSEAGHSGRAGWLAYGQLLRPANIVTAWADVLAGAAAAGVFLWAAGAIEALPGAIGWLVLATSGLYGGGVVLNDVFDAELDAEERPERPIPSGRVSLRNAAIFGGVCLLVGVAAAAMVSALSAVIATIIAGCAVVYDRYGKHHPVFGPLNMGLCRGGNLLLGVSAIPAMVPERWMIALLPVFYIAAITAVSRGEVHGGRHGTGWLAVGLVAVVMGGLVGLELLPAYAVRSAAPFLVLFALLVGPPFVRAARQPQPEHIRNAVRAGVLALIVFDATLAAGFAGWPAGLGVLVLWPVSVGLARAFAVT